MIQGYWQTDARLLPAVRTFGCALLDGIWLSPVDYQPSDVNEMYKALLQVGFVDEQCTVLDWESVLNSISPHFHFKAKASQEYVCLVNEREILKWFLKNVNENHFTVGNGASMTAWDSMNRPDIMKAYAVFVDKVIVTIST
jgi:Protein of unknown function, DUF261